MDRVNLVLDPLHQEEVAVGEEKRKQKIIKNQILGLVIIK